jgi:hypothetical protein
VVYQNRVVEPSLRGGPQVAGPDGFAVFPFNASGFSAHATAIVTCTYRGVTETATYPFTVTSPPGRPGTGAPLPTTCTASGAGVHAGISLRTTAPPQRTFINIIGCFFFNGKPVPGVPATFNLDYVNGTSQPCGPVFTNLNGFAGCFMYIGNPPAGFQATAIVRFFYQNQVYQATENFVPVANP